MLGAELGSEGTQVRRSRLCCWAHAACPTVVLPDQGAPAEGLKAGTVQLGHSSAALTCAVTQLFTVVPGAMHPVLAVELPVYGAFSGQRC